MGLWGYLVMAPPSIPMAGFWLATDLAGRVPRARVSRRVMAATLGCWAMAVLVLTAVMAGRRAGSVTAEMAGPG